MSDAKRDAPPTRTPSRSSPPPAGDGSAHVLAPVAPRALTGPPSAEVSGKVAIVYSRKKRKTLPQVLRCAVTVVFKESRQDGATLYVSGFIVMSHDNRAFIFTKYLGDIGFNEKKSEIFVQFNGRNVQNQPALMLCSDSEYMIIAAVEERNDNQPVSEPIAIPQSHSGATYEKCYTIATMSGTKLHASSDADLSHFRGRLGTYFGKVLTPNCRAFSHSKERRVVEKSENYFTVSCPFKDEMVSPDNIDVPSEQHTSTRVLGAPVFRTGGEMLGVIDWPSNYFDVKYSLHSREMTARIGKMCSVVKPNLDWKDKLKILYQIKEEVEQSEAEEEEEEVESQHT